MEDSGGPELLRSFGPQASAGINYGGPGILSDFSTDFGQRAVILTLTEIRSFIRKPYIHS